MNIDVLVSYERGGGEHRLSEYIYMYTYLLETEFCGVFMFHSTQLGQNKVPVPCYFVEMMYSMLTYTCEVPCNIFDQFNV